MARRLQRDADAIALFGVTRTHIPLPPDVPPTGTHPWEPTIDQMPSQTERAKCGKCKGKREITCLRCPPCKKCGGRKLLACKTCLGTGKCKYCNGLGYTERIVHHYVTGSNFGGSYDDIHRDTCKGCDGKRSCSYCRGAGSFSCKACNATGLGDCGLCGSSRRVPCPSCTGR